MGKGIVVLCVAASLALSACEGDPAQSSFLLSPARNTAPAISGKVSTVASLWRRLRDAGFGLESRAHAIPAMPSDCKATYGYMCLGWEIFVLIRDYDPALDLGGEDRINSEDIYFALNLAGLVYEQYAGEAQALGADRTLPSPMDFGATAMPAETYSRAANGLTLTGGFGYDRGEVNIAVREEGTARHFLISAGADPSWSGRHKLVMQGFHDPVSGDLELNYAQFTTYPSDAGTMAGQSTVLRTWIRGNENTHRFEIVAGSGNNGSGPDMWNWSSIQGAGYSKGAGRHFLMFYRGTNASQDPNGVPGAGTVGAYYCIGADTTKASFGAGIYEKPEGYSADQVPAACAEYRDTVAALPRWEMGTDFPTSPDSPLFTGAGALNLSLGF